MTRTRIRAVRPVGSPTGGSGGGSVGDGNPVGSSLTTDDFSVAITAPEPSPAPGEAATFALTASSAESSTAPAETDQFFAVMTAAPDPASTPSEDDSAVVLVGASSVAAGVAQGSNWSNPANAGGVNDGAVATLTGTAGLQPPPQNATLTLTYAATQLQAGATLDTVIVYGSVAPAALGGTATLAMSVSNDGGTNYTAPQTISSTNAGPFPLSFTGVTPATLAAGGVRIRLVGTAQGTAVAASTVTVDAAVLTFNA